MTIPGISKSLPLVNRQSSRKGEALVNDIQSLRHTVWECKYHVVWVPKYRRKVLYGQIRQYLGEVLRELAGHRESKVIEGHLRPDHVHMLVSIPPKYSVAQVVGYVKGKSAIYVARNYLAKKSNFTRQSFWGDGTTSQRSGRMKRPFGSTLRSRKKPIESLTR